ncbi:MAG TPA: DsbE family thiol:disulfide interchange protein [Rhizomicrobium sp.]|nr:DsbE family thiol:disulfide interchange protein [Rhizomicrobium sp.]
MKRLIYIVPVLAFAVLAYVLFASLIAPAPDTLPSALLNKPVPDIALPALDKNVKGFARADFASGHVTVVNVWASWCAPCRAEAPLLAAISGLQGVKLYGFVYKDTPANARGFLAQYGNPFDRLGLDKDGRAGIEWGVYGVPETYVIDGRGIIRARFVGPLTPQSLAGTLLPEIERARSGS